MDEKNENSDKKKSQKFRILALVIFVLIFMATGTFFLIKSRQQESNSDLDKNASGLEENKTVEMDENNESKNDESGEQKTDLLESQTDVVEDKKTMVSENYRVSQVHLGVGGISIEKGLARDTKLEIFQVKSETIISQEDNEPRILITWKTNKEAISNVEYAKSDGKNAVVITEDGYGFEHSMLIKNMEYSAIYTYRIESSDRWGNKTNTEYFSAYTGDKTESIFDLITNAVEDVFGWAM